MKTGYATTANLIAGNSPAILERGVGVEPLKRKGELLPQWAQIQTGELRIDLEDSLLLPKPANGVSAAFHAARKLAQRLASDLAVARICSRSTSTPKAEPGRVAASDPSTHPSIIRLQCRRGVLVPRSSKVARSLLGV